jgi:hypothetical protein
LPVVNWQEAAKEFAHLQDDDADEKALITKLFDSYLEKGSSKNIRSMTLMPSTFPSFVSSRQTVRQPQLELFGIAQPSLSTTE